MRPDPILSFSRGTLLLQGVWKTDLQRVFGVDAWQWDARVSGWRCNAYRYGSYRRQLDEASVPLVDRVVQWRSMDWSAQHLARMRPDQAAAIAAWLASCRGCIVMPTGSGKTEITLALMARTSLSTLVVVPVRDLMYQWQDRIRTALGYDAGLIGDGQYVRRPVTITTYDSACIYMEQLGNQFGMLVFDECHHLPGRVRQDAARMSAAPMRLGLTATPERADGLHVLLDDLIGPIVFRHGLAIARGRTLAMYDVERIAVRLAADEQRRYDRLSAQIRAFIARRRRTDPTYDWKKVCSESVVSRDAREALRAYLGREAIEHRAAEKLRVLEDLFRLHDGESILVFAGSNAMAREVSRRFLVPCLLSSSTPQERRDVLEGFATGRYPVLVANRVLDEGLDVPEVKVAIVLGGTASVRQSQQRLGRVLRRSGNAIARLYEVVCTETKEERRVRLRHQCDAFQTARHCDLRPK